MGASYIPWTFTVDIHRTSRAESLNSVIKRYVNLNWNLKMFQENQIKHLYDNGTTPLVSIENSIAPCKRNKSGQ